MKEGKDKIIEILFAWYDAQQNAVMDEPTELDAIKRQGERTDLTSAQLGQRLTSVEKISAESDESKRDISGSPV